LETVKSKMVRQLVPHVHLMWWEGVLVLTV
jgi:hypothetical protein